MFFLVQILESTDPAQIATLKVNLTQFINDKFLYDHMVAMETLIQCGMKEQLIELAKVSQNTKFDVYNVNYLVCSELYTYDRYYYILS